MLPRLAREVGAASVHISAESTPFGRRRDERVREALGREDVTLAATGTPYAVGPGTLTTGGGTPYQVFTPFARAWRAHGWPRPAPSPATCAGPPGRLRGPARGSATTCPTCPPAGEPAALERWHAFLDERHRRTTPSAVTARTWPAPRGSRRHLKYGEVHPRTLLADLRRCRTRGPRADHVRDRAGLARVLRRRAVAPARLRARATSSRTADDDVRRPGRPPRAARGVAATGAPASRSWTPGMRQLLAEGWVHNRVRMIVASFLVKDLHIWWPHGARHFLRHLRRRRLASNNHGWQWVAGTGTDASPYFRVFNPVPQGRRFDPDGDYVRRCVPELRAPARRRAHEPWRRPTATRTATPSRSSTTRTSARSRSPATPPPGTDAAASD